MKKYSFIFLAILYFSVSIFAQKSENDRKMNQPFEPFKIIGNVYYVGASDVTSYLITTPNGHILIDSGFSETVPQITANVAKLGFKMEDIKILLLNHAHYDHCAGLAEIKKMTNARLYASAPDAKVLEDGGKSDFRFGKDPDAWFTPVKADEILKDGQEIKLGGMTLKTYFTFGHTKGATSWTTDVTENGRKYKVAFVSSLTTLDYALNENPQYPNVKSDFTKTFAKLEKIKADVALSSHGQFFDLTAKAEKVRSGAKTNPFISKKDYADLIAGMKKTFNEKLQKELKGEK